MTTFKPKLKYQDLPLRTNGGVPTFKETDPESSKPVFQQTSGTGIYDMSDPEQAAEYRRITDRIYAEQAVCRDRQRVYVPEKNTWMIYLEWTDQYYHYNQESTNE